ncbi:MAG: Na(+)/H(+) antiporter subunit D [Pseudomonadota bacterium]
MSNVLLPPPLILIIGALVVPFLRGRLKSGFMLLLPVVVFWTLLQMPEGKYWGLKILEYDVILGRVDRLSMVFGYIFTLITFIGILFALKVEDDLQHVSALMYAGGALGVTFSGDFFSLYIFWEVLAISSTFLILARRTKSSQEAAYRYILVHVVGGLCLLAGIVVYVQEKGSLEFGSIGLGGLGSWLIFIGIALNAAIFPLHSWLPDAYPEATVTGAVFMSALTTKSAVYVMARTFPGTELLIWLGAFMTVIPLFYALLENDIRKVLAYSIISQGGFMMCGIGIGTPLAINGAVSHAFCSILYTALLFMSAGSVLHMTGKIRCTDLGGLYKTMPLTCLFYLIGAASISGLPLFSGFVSKSMVISAAAHEKMLWPWLFLTFASACTFFYAALKVPFAAFFGPISVTRSEEPPLHMILAMGIAAFLSLIIGLYPDLLYVILPKSVDYVPYTGSHVVGHLQLAMFAGLAFCLFIRSEYYHAEEKAVYLDVDWFYRKGGSLFYRFMDKILNGFNRYSHRLFVQGLAAGLAQWSRVPLSLIIHLYMKAAGKEAYDFRGIKESSRPEASNIMSMGMPVFLSFICLFCLIVVFVVLI